MLYLWLEDVNCQWHRQLYHASCSLPQRNYIFAHHFNRQKIWIAQKSRCILMSHRKECQANVIVDEVDVEITLSIPTNLGSFSQVPVFHGIAFTKSPRPPYSTLVGHLAATSIVHWMKSEGRQGYPEQRGTEGRYPGQRGTWDRGIRGKST